MFRMVLIAALAATASFWLAARFGGPPAPARGWWMPALTLCSATAAVLVGAIVLPFFLAWPLIWGWSQYPRLSDAYIGLAIAAILICPIASAIGWAFLRRGRTRPGLLFSLTWLWYPVLWWLTLHLGARLAT